MTSISEVESFLREYKYKMGFAGIFFRDDRGKNQQALFDLEISPTRRKEIIANLKPEDYCDGPIEERLHGILPMWIFGKEVKQNEVYIKLSMGILNGKAVCLSFHVAEHPLIYPFKK